jgi:hypothetical protein
MSGRRWTGVEVRVEQALVLYRGLICVNAGWSPSVGFSRTRFLKNRRAFRTMRNGVLTVSEAGLARTGGGRR